MEKRAVKIEGILSRPSTGWLILDHEDDEVRRALRRGLSDPEILRAYAVYTLSDYEEVLSR